MGEREKGKKNIGRGGNFSFSAILGKRIFSRVMAKQFSRGTKTILSDS
jgi:hypothetical protein